MQQQQRSYARYSNSELLMASDKLILINGLKDSLRTFDISTDPVQLEFWTSEVFFFVSEIVIPFFNCCACTSIGITLYKNRNDTKKTVPTSNEYFFLVEHFFHSKEMVIQL